MTDDEIQVIVAEKFGGWKNPRFDYENGSCIFKCWMAEINGFNRNIPNYLLDTSHALLLLEKQPYFDINFAAGDHSYQVSLRHDFEAECEEENFKFAPIYIVEKDLCRAICLALIETLKK